MKRIFYKILLKCFNILVRLLPSFKTKLRSNEAVEYISSLYSANSNIDEKKTMQPTCDLQPNQLDLTIIVPVYNSEKYLKKCMDSIIHQRTQYKYEVIAINDGSIDGSEKILREYSRRYSFFKVINQKNKGISAARNIGIDNALGEYISFVDNDDILEDRFIQEMLTYAYKDDVEYLECGYIKFSGTTDQVIQIHKEGITGFIWGSIMKKSLWENVRFPIGFWYEDMIKFGIIIPKAKSYKFINEPLYCYNWHDMNASKKIWKKDCIKSLDQFFLFKEIVDYSAAIQLNNQAVLFKNSLSELGPLLWSRTFYLDRKIKKAIFILACDLVEDIYCKVNLLDNEMLIFNIFIRRCYFKWYLYGLMRKVKSNIKKKK